MAGDTLYAASEGAIGLALVASLLLTGEGGYQLGLRNRRSRPADGTQAAEKSQLDLLEGALLGLVALLMGFTFSMTIGRYDTRKARVVEEANAIGTAALRVGLLPAPYRTAASASLVEYVELRLGAARAGIPAAERADEQQRTEALQLRLWSLAARASSEDPRSTAAALFAAAVNELIDDHAKRQAALADHVPILVLWLLWLSAVAAAGLTGYGAGAGGRRAAVGLAVFAIVTALVFLMIIDLDRPYRGLVRVSQQSMRDTRDLVLRLDRAWRAWRAPP